VDTTAIGQAAAALMEHAGEEFGEDAKVEAAVVIVDVSYRDEDEDDCTAVRYCARDGDGNLISAAHSAGLVTIAQDQIVTP
jgi:hypothetical protein